MQKLYIIFILMVVLMTGCNKETVDLTQADVEILDKKTVKRTENFQGVIRSSEPDFIVTTELIDYPVKEIKVQVGDVVEAGEVLCVLDAQGKKLTDNQSVEIVATYGGVVSEIYAIEGVRPIDGMIMSITDAQNLCAEIWIDEKEISQVELGQNVSVYSEEIEGVESFGNVNNISQIKEEDGFRAVISLERMTQFKIGMNIQVKIELDTWENVLAVQKTAIQIDENGYYVLIANKDKEGTYILQRREVYSISDGDTMSVINSGDIKQGDYLVVDAKNYAEDEKVYINILKGD